MTITCLITNIICCLKLDFQYCLLLDTGFQILSATQCWILNAVCYSTSNFQFSSSPFLGASTVQQPVIGVLTKKITAGRRIWLWPHCQLKGRKHHYLWLRSFQRLKFSLVVDIRKIEKNSASTINCVIKAALLRQRWTCHATLNS